MDRLQVSNTQIFPKIPGHRAWIGLGMPGKDKTDEVIWGQLKFVLVQDNNNITLAYCADDVKNPTR